MELCPLVARAGWILTRADPEYRPEHLQAFLTLIEKRGCDNVEFFRGQFRFDSDDVTVSGDKA